MDTYNIQLHGLSVSAFVANSEAAINNRITLFRQIQSYRRENHVFGLDVKWLKSNDGRYTSPLLILSTYDKSVIVRLGYEGNTGKALEILDRFLNDPNICFVGVRHLPSNPIFSNTYVGIQVGDLAARVLKDPALTSMSLADIASKLGFPYQPSPNQTDKIEVDSRNVNVLTKDQVIAAATDSYAYFRIGCILMSRITSSS